MKSTNITELQLGWLYWLYKHRGLWVRNFSRIHAAIAMACCPIEST